MSNFKVRNKLVENVSLGCKDDLLQPLTHSYFLLVLCFLVHMRNHNFKIGIMSIS